MYDGEFKSSLIALTKGLEAGKMGNTEEMAFQFRKANNLMDMHLQRIRRG